MGSKSRSAFGTDPSSRSLKYSRRRPLLFSSFTWGTNPYNFVDVMCLLWPRKIVYDFTALAGDMSYLWGWICFVGVDALARRQLLPIGAKLKSVGLVDFHSSVTTPLGFGRAKTPITSRCSSFDSTRYLEITSVAGIRLPFSPSAPWQRIIADDLHQARRQVHL